MPAKLERPGNGFLPAAPRGVALPHPDFSPVRAVSDFRPSRTVREHVCAV